MNITEKMNFATELHNNGIVISNEEIDNIFLEVDNALIKHKDHTEEEILEEITKDLYKESKRTLDNRIEIPGYGIGLNAGNYQYEIYGGYQNYDSNRAIDETTLFDKASMQKLDTQIVIYNLIKDQIIDFNQTVKSIVPEFENMEETTIRELTTFGVGLNTNGRIDSMTSEEEAKNCLYSAKPVRIDNNGNPIVYNYNDIGTMILKEIAEKVTGKSYIELTNYYIKNKLTEENYFTKVSSDEIEFLTGTPNEHIALANDPKLYYMGKTHGHAGGFSSVKSQMDVVSSCFDKLLPIDMVKDLYTPGVEENRGIMGNTYVYHKKGLDKTFVDNCFSKKSFAVQGSTRTLSLGSKIEIGNIEYLNSAAILLNPASMGLENAYRKEQEINQKRALRDNSLPALNLVKEKVNKSELYFSIDPRQMAPLGNTSDPITQQLAKTSIKMMYLSKVLNKKENEKVTMVSKTLNKTK